MMMMMMMMMMMTMMMPQGPARNKRQRGSKDDLPPCLHFSSFPLVWWL